MSIRKRFREAELKDIPQMQIVRNSVKENMLSNPDIIRDKEYEDYLLKRGKGWVCEIAGMIAGFGIADLKEHNVWALFIHPDFEKNGIGRKLHDMMIDWYFGKTKTDIWLGTACNTRAEAFYRKAGWTETGTHGSLEIKFEMTFDNWEKLKPFRNS